MSHESERLYYFTKTQCLSFSDARIRSKSARRSTARCQSAESRTRRYSQELSSPAERNDILIEAVHLENKSSNRRGSLHGRENIKAARLLFHLEGIWIVTGSIAVIHSIPIITVIG